MGTDAEISEVPIVMDHVMFIFFLSLYAFPPGGALGYEADVNVMFIEEHARAFFAI